LKFGLKLYKIKNETFNLKVPLCNITDELALSALRRAKTPECQNEIERLACSIKDQIETGDENTDGVYRIRLKSSCPYSYRNELVGCQLKHNFIEFIENYNKTINSSLISLVLLKQNVISIDLCIDICLSVNQHKYVAYDEESINCYCIKNLTNTFFNELLFSKIDICGNTNLNPIRFYDTGLISNLNIIQIKNLLIYLSFEIRNTQI
jgi:hypothetical protein